MFCTKCGYNMGNNTVCPNCGNVEEIFTESESSTSTSQTTGFAGNSSAGHYNDQINQTGQTGNQYSGQTGTGYQQTGSQYSGQAGTGYQQTESQYSGQAGTGYQQTGSQYSGQAGTGYQQTGSQYSGQAGTGYQQTGNQYSGQTGTQPSGSQYTNYQNTAFQGNFNQQYSGNSASQVMGAPVKKKKWPRITAIIVAIIAVIGVGVYFAYPYISSALSPKKKAVTALKNFNSDLTENITGSANKTSEISTNKPIDLKMTVNVSKCQIDGEDLLKDIKADTFNYDIQMDSSNSAAAVSVGFASGLNSILDINCYCEDQYIYMAMPQLFSQTLKMSSSSLSSVQKKIDSGAKYQSYTAWPESSTDLDSLFGSMDSDQASRIAKVCASAVKDVVGGIDTIYENCEYEKIGKEDVEGPNGSIKATKYEVTLTKDAMEQGVDKVIDNLYDDSEISSYMKLFETYSGYSQDDLRTKAKASLTGMPDIPFTIYVDDKDRLVKVYFDVSKITSGKDSGYISLVFTGDKSVYDNTVIEINDGTNKASINFSKDADGNSKMGFNLESASDKLVFEADATSTSTSMSINSAKIQGTLGSKKVDFEFSGQYSMQNISSITICNPDSANVIDVENMTDAQAAQLSKEVVTNISVLKQLFSEDYLKKNMGDTYYKLEQIGQIYKQYDTSTQSYSTTY